MTPFDLNTRYAQHTQRVHRPDDVRRPLIGITANYAEGLSTLAEGYYKALLRAGAQPLILPPTEEMDGIEDLLDGLDGLLLSGGADLNPLWLGEEPVPALGSINPERDAWELLLVRLAVDRQLPLLGICRGMQVIAAALGGSLHQDLATSLGDALSVKHSQSAPRSQATHSVRIADDSVLHRLLGAKTVVNSFHHQAVADCGTQLRPTAWSTDGVIEALESSEHKSILAVQWHPECMDTAAMGALFEHLTTEARAYRRARHWHAQHLSLDSHCDTPMFFHKNIDFNHRDAQLLVDSHKMREGGLDASIMVAYLPQGERSPEAHAAATARAHQLLDQLEVMVERCPTVALAYAPHELHEHKRAGLRSVMPGIENGYAFGTDLNQIEKFRRRGIVYTTLCHNGNNEICDSARPSQRDRELFPNGAEHGGLSPFGREVVAEMNRVGMLVDVSHAAESTFYDALEASQVPIVASHSSARALCNHPRNLTDDQLRALAARGGVAQCTFYAGFLCEDADKATIHDALRHLLHMIAVAGIDHVGIGTDFDGDGGVPGLESASALIRLTQRLQAEGLSDQELAQLWGGNFLRVMQQAQAASALRIECASL